MVRLLHFKFFIPRFNQQAVESASGYRYKRLTPLHLTSQVEQINTDEIGKTQVYASFVNSIVAIQGHYNDTLPDQSKCYMQVLSLLDNITNTAFFTISFALKVYTGRTD